MGKEIHSHCPEGKHAAHAGEMLCAAREAAAPFIGAVSAWPNKVVKCFARLDICTARYIMGKQGESKEVFTPLEEIASRFAREFMEAVPGSCTNDFAAVLDASRRSTGDRPVAKAKAKAKAAVEKARATAKALGGPHLPLYELNVRGEATTGIARLRSAGFDLGATVRLHPPLADFDPDVTWVVDEVSDIVSIRNLLSSEVKTVVQISAFLKTAKPASSGAAIVRHPGWPRARTVRTDVAMVRFTMSRVLFALEVLADSVGNSVEELVEIYEKPSRSVRAKRDLGVGELIALPETIVVKVLDVKDEMPSGAVRVFLPQEPWSFERRIVLLGSNTGDSVCPYWAFERTPNQHEANMVEVIYRVDLLAGADIIPETGSELFDAGLREHTGAAAKAAPRADPTPASRTMRSLASRAPADDEAFQRCVNIPVLANAVAVSAGSELKVGTSVSASRSEAAKAILASSLTKKARLA